MKKYFLLIAMMMGAMVNTMAQSVVANDTLYVTVDSISHQPNPNNGDYVAEFFGLDSKGKRQKVAIRYESESEFGTFSNSDFYNWNGEHGSGSYNFIREQNNSDKFFSFTEELTVSVTDSMGAIVYDLNGIYKNFGRTRVLLHAEITAPTPDDTVEVDLGQATVIPMNQMGYQYLRLDASNATYSLAFGLTGMDALQAGTYYRTDLLRPDFVVLPNDTVPMSDATLVVTDRTDGYHNLAIALLSDDNILYSITMHTGAVVATDTVQVVCRNGLLQNLTEMYGIYQMAGVSVDYQVAIGLTPGVIERSMRSFTSDSVNLAYTRLLDVATGEFIYVAEASGRLVPDSSAFLPRVLVYADLLGINGTLYQVALPIGGSQLPTAVDTTMVECGDYVGRLDYTYGAGYLGLVVGNEDYDAHVLVYNGMQMRGSFGTDMFLYNDDVEGDSYVSYLTMYNVDGVDYRLSNISACEMRMDSIGDTVRIELNVVTETGHMFCFRANLLPTRALTGEEVSYTINDPLMDDGMMVGFLMDKTGNEQTFYVQFQRSDAWDEDGTPMGENSEVWSYVFMQDSVDGIAGTYGYSAGTLMEDQYHMLKEHNTEIWLMPMAGTLTITVEQPVTLPAQLTGWGVDYRTHIYSVQSDMVMENGMLYHVTGSNFLLCLDYVTEQMVELTEDVLTAIDEVLSEQGLRVKKVLRNGLILLESADHAYTISGQLVR